MKTLKQALKAIFEEEARVLAAQASPMPQERLDECLATIRATLERKHIWQGWLRALSPITWAELLKPLSLNLQPVGHFGPPGTRLSKPKLVQALLNGPQNQRQQAVPIEVITGPLPEVEGLSMEVFLSPKNAPGSGPYEVALVTTADREFQSEADRLLNAGEKTWLHFNWDEAGDAIELWRRGGDGTPRDGTSGPELEKLPFRLVLQPAGSGHN